MSISKRLVPFYVLLALLCLPFVSHAQWAGVDPYSSYGIGDLSNETGVQGFSMGQTGIANNPWSIIETHKVRYFNKKKGDTETHRIFIMDTLAPYFVDLKNPASYYYNRITTFEAGLLNNNYIFSTQGQTHSNSNANFGYFTLAFPVSNHFGASLGLQPMTTVGYSITTSPTVDSVGQINNLYQGSGGINQVHIGLAYSPVRNISVGVNVSYLFGNITNIQNVVFPPNILDLNSQVTQTTTIRSFYLNYGLMWTSRLPMPGCWQLTAGLTAALPYNVNATFNKLAITDVIAAPQTNIDTIVDSTAKGSIRLPLMVGVGLTLKKGNNWMFTFDYSMQNWSQYQYFGTNGNLSNSTQMGFGIQYIPKRNLGSFFQRIHYRAGFYYNTSYLDLNNTQLQDYGVTMGIAVPVGPINMMKQSLINIGMQLGQLGTTSNNLMRQQYLKFMFAFTFDDRWFQKRYYE